MHKRRLEGIIKYGKRSRKVKKFQSGGTTAIDHAYDWRDDPYEKMLMRNKLIDDRNKAYAAKGSGRYRSGSSGGRSGGSSNSKLNNFDELTGGLMSDNRAVNLMYQKEQQNYYNKILEDPDYANTYNAQIEHQNIEQKYKSLNRQLVAIEDRYKELRGKLKDTDKEALAISSDINSKMFVYDSAEGENGFKIVALTDYLKDTERYNIRTINDFMQWRENNNPSMTMGDIEAFMGAGALGPQSMEDNYFKVNNDRLQYKLTKDKQLIKTSNTTGQQQEIGNIKYIQSVIANIRIGNDPNEGIDVTRQHTDTESLLAAVTDVYKDIMQNTADSSRLRASLVSEVLKDVTNRAILNKIEDPEKRMLKLDQLVKLELVSRFFDESYKKKASSKSSSESSGGGGSALSTSDDPIDPKGNPGSLTSLGAINTLFDADQINTNSFKISKQFTEAGDDAKRPKVNTLVLPSVRFAGPDKLNIPRDPDNVTPEQARNLNILDNELLGDVTLKSDFVTLNGVSLASYFGSEEKAREFLSSHAILSPQEDITITYLPIDADTGKPLLQEAFKSQRLKLSARKAYLKSIAKKDTQNRTSKVPANKLYLGNMREGADVEYRNYVQWLKRGKNAAKYKKIADADPTNTEKKAQAIMAEDAARALNRINDGMSAVFNGKKVKMQPYLSVGIVFNDDGNLTLKDKYDEKSKLSGFAMGGVRKANDEEVKVLKKIADKDDWSFNLKNIGRGKILDENYATTIFMPMMPASQQATWAGEKTKAVQSLHKLQEASSRGINDSTVFVKRSLPLAYNFAL